MKRNQMLFFIVGLLTLINVRSSDDDVVVNNHWKIDFFQQYMNGYNELQERTHDAISEVLKNSFSQSVHNIPDSDQALAQGVKDQIEFFIHLKDPNLIADEMEKCLKGMALANSIWAKLAPMAAKAERFVNKFYAEYKKRTLGLRDYSLDMDEE